MGKKKKRKLEERQSFTDAFVGALFAQATGEARVAATAAREVCAGLYERAFASARVEPETPETRALTVDALGMIGRAFITAGECVFAIDADPADGVVSLSPSSGWDVRGTVEPASWQYKADFAGPDMTVTRILSGDSVLHFRYAVEAARPWKGLSPLALSNTTQKIDEGISQQLADESQRSSGYVGTVPVGLKSENFEALKTTIPKMRGKMALLEAGGNWDPLTQGGRPGMDITRVGADPPPSILSIWQFSTSLVLASCGVPIELLQLADGTGNRESFRRFLVSTIQPCARRVEAELSDKFDMAVKLDFSGVQAADVAGRARAYQSMRLAGMKPQKAERLAGLMVEEE